MQFVITCAAGLESILQKEIEIAGYKVLWHTPTLVRFTGDLSAIAKVNLRSRVWNKLFLELGKKHISDFDGLFDLVSQIDWSMYIQNNPIVVTAASKKSKLTSTPTIQSICKKAIVKKLLKNPTHQNQCRDALHASPKLTPWGVGILRVESEGKVFEDPKLEPVEIFVHLQNNMCSILLNTTGESLHKRWYKQATGEAPINEALAAGLLLLSWWKFSEPLYDMFCGSGTIAIEAAMIAKNIAPGILRWFAFQYFSRYDQTLFDRAVQEAKGKMMLDKHHTIIASDIDPQMIKIAQENAKNAWVEKYINFAVKDVKEYIGNEQLAGALVSNPPYGLRLQMYELIQIYRTITQLFDTNPQLHGGIISSYEDFSPNSSSWTRKKTTFYNGGEKCIFYKKTLLK